MELLYDAFQKSHAFFIVIIAFYDGHFKDEAAVILRPEGFHIGSILLQGITRKGPLTFLETGIRSILEFADNGSQRLARAWYSADARGSHLKEAARQLLLMNEVNDTGQG